LAGCNRTLDSQTLDRQAAFSVLKAEGGVGAAEVIGRFSSSPGSSDVPGAYIELVEKGVLTCEAYSTLGTTCRPGPKGKDLKAIGTEIRFLPGKFVLSRVLQITKDGDKNADVTVELKFQESEIYGRYKNQFDRLDKSLSARTQPQMRSCYFGKGENGWHLAAKGIHVEPH